MTQVSTDSEKKIMAVFRPQQWREGHAIDIEEARAFDATVHVLSMSTHRIRHLQDHTFMSDALADMAGFLQEHDGPYEVEIEEGLKRYFGVDALEQITEQQVENARARDHRRKPMRVDDTDDSDQVRPAAAAASDLSRLPSQEAARIGAAIDRREVIGFKSGYGVCVFTGGIDGQDYPELYRLTAQARHQGYDWLFLHREVD